MILRLSKFHIVTTERFCTLDFVLEEKRGIFNQVAELTKVQSAKIPRISSKTKSSVQNRSES